MADPRPSETTAATPRTDHAPATAAPHPDHAGRAAHDDDTPATASPRPDHAGPAVHEDDRPATAEPRLDHVGLAVHDLDASAEWYCAAFGYERELRLRVDPIDLDIVMLRHAAHGDRLELLHRPGSSAGRRAANPAEAALSETFGHIAFDVRGLDAAFERAVGLGARPVMTPQPSPEKGVRMAYVADPEGNLVELLERP